MSGDEHIAIFSPATRNKEIFKWFSCKPGELKEENVEIVEVISRIVSDIKEISEDCVLKDLINKVDKSSHSSVSKLCEIYNDLISRQWIFWDQNGIIPDFYNRRATRDHIQFILSQCYSRAVPEPDKLNQYPPFSPQVYGETSFELISQMIGKVQINADDIFIDLGSGVGQVVLQVSALCQARFCYGIEKAEYPSKCASRLDIEFRHWMSFYGKSYSPFLLERGDFLSADYQERITSASVLFANNFAFGPEVDYQLKQRFANLKEGAKIISSKAFCPLNFRITDRNLSDIGSIMHVDCLNPIQDAVSWTDKPFSYYIHTIDRSLLEQYFARLKNPKSMDDIQLVRRDRKGRIISEQCLSKHNSSSAPDNDSQPGQQFNTKSINSSSTASTSPNRSIISSSGVNSTSSLVLQRYKRINNRRSSSLPRCLKSRLSASNTTCTDSNDGSNNIIKKIRNKRIKDRSKHINSNNSIHKCIERSHSIINPISNDNDDDDDDDDVDNMNRSNIINGTVDKSVMLHSHPSFDSIKFKLKLETNFASDELNSIKQHSVRLKRKVDGSDKNDDDVQTIVAPNANTNFDQTKSESPVSNNFNSMSLQSSNDETNCNINNNNNNNGDSVINLSNNRLCRALRKCRLSNCNYVSLQSSNKSAVCSAGMTNTASYSHKVTSTAKLKTQKEKSNLDLFYEETMSQIGSFNSDLNSACQSRNMKTKTNRTTIHNTSNRYNDLKLTQFIEQYRPLNIYSMDQLNLDQIELDSTDFKSGHSSDPVPLALMQYLELSKQVFMDHFKMMRSTNYHLTIRTRLEQEQRRQTELIRSIKYLDNSINKLHQDGVILLNEFIKRLGILITTPAAFFAQARRLIKHHHVLSEKTTELRKQISELTISNHELIKRYQSETARILSMSVISNSNCLMQKINGDNNNNNNAHAIPISFTQSEHQQLPPPPCLMKLIRCPPVSVSQSSLTDQSGTGRPVYSLSSPPLELNKTSIQSTPPSFAVITTSGAVNTSDNSKVVDAAVIQLPSFSTAINLAEFVTENKLNKSTNVNPLPPPPPLLPMTSSVHHENSLSNSTMSSEYLSKGFSFSSPSHSPVVFCLNAHPHLKPPTSSDLHCYSPTTTSTSPLGHKSKSIHVSLQDLILDEFTHPKYTTTSTTSVCKSIATTSSNLSTYRSDYALNPIERKRSSTRKLASCFPFSKNDNERNISTPSKYPKLATPVLYNNKYHHQHSSSSGDSFGIRNGNLSPPTLSPYQPVVEDHITVHGALNNNNNSYSNVPVSCNVQIIHSRNSNNSCALINDRDDKHADLSVESLNCDESVCRVGKSNHISSSTQPPPLLFGHLQ